MTKTGFCCGNWSCSLGLGWDLLSQVSFVSSALSSDAGSHSILSAAWCPKGLVFGRCWNIPMGDKIPIPALSVPFLLWP